MSPEVAAAPEVSLADFKEAAKVVSSFAYHTPLLTSRLLRRGTSSRNNSLAVFIDGVWVMPCLANASRVKPGAQRSEVTIEQR